VRLKPAVFDDAAVDGFYQALAGKGTRVANGSWFGDEARIFRLGFGLLPMAELGETLAALAAALRKAAQPGRSS
jgi:DNA-binding transcriptional MocR family regulator